MLAAGVDLLIGMNHEKRVPSHPVRPQATLAAWFTNRRHPRRSEDPCQSARNTSWSISQNYPPEHDEGNGYSWVALLYGATFGEPQSLVPLARSWNRAPELRVLSGGAESRGYDIGQRAYTLRCSPGTGCGDLGVEIGASVERPLANALLVIEGFGDGAATVSVNGQRLDEGAGLRLGRRQTLEGTDLIVWLERAATAKVEVRITGATPAR